MTFADSVGVRDAVPWQSPAAANAASSGITKSVTTALNAVACRAPFCRIGPRPHTALNHVVRAGGEGRARLDRSHNVIDILIVLEGLT